MPHYGEVDSHLDSLHHKNTVLIVSDIIIPKHVAVIMDGNGRWAKKRLLPRIAGHKAGAKSVSRLIENCLKHKVQALTLFAFSTENWSRPPKEVDSLMSLFMEHLKSQLKVFQKHHIRLRVIGNRQLFSKELQQQISETEAATIQNEEFTLVLAASYGGRWDITNACQAIAKQVASGKIATNDINENLVGEFMATSDLPEPELLIRTSGEERISNFMLWQCAYSEFYFTDTLWPDFGNKDFEQALQCFGQRQRRFGEVVEH